ncbi:MAG: ATP-binding protein [Candidatus Omnitrophica bacterium]|nr:ATP-binding protein [Candidatus Omnitrophota bacterium]
MKIIKRLFQLDLPPNRSAFLWGPRKVGKSYWVTHSLPKAPILDLLKTDVFADYASRPSLLRERYQDHRGLLVIDEVQKIPALLDEVHWLIENKGLSFLLTGSSARKLRRGHANLLGGRAWRRTMTPLSCLEVDELDLERIMISGLLPPHYLSPAPLEDLRAYVADYLKEEVVAEALVQNLPAFSEFLRVAAITSSELVNYTNIAREVGVASRFVRTYFDILEDTYLGFRVPPWKKSKTRRMILTEKFYLFDVGVANFLARRAPRLGSAEFGKSFEHYLLMELRAYQAYKSPDLPVCFWRTSAGQEVDFILGDKDIAVEIKGSAKVHEGDLTSLMALMEDGPVKKCVVVCLEKEPRLLSKKIEVLPWRVFIERLWKGDFGV